MQLEVEANYGISLASTCQIIDVSRPLVLDCLSISHG